MRITKAAETPKPPATPFAALAKGHDRLLWGYFGLQDEYAIILSLARDFVKAYAPDVQVTIATRPEAAAWVGDAITEAEYHAAGNDWLDKHEFKTAPAPPHPVETYLSWLPFKPPTPARPKPGSVGLLVPASPQTARSLSPEQTRQAEAFLSRFGLPVVRSPDIPDNLGAVAGVEGPAVWAAIKAGRPVAVPEYSTGLGLLTKLGGTTLR